MSIIWFFVGWFAISILIAAVYVGFCAKHEGYRFWFVKNRFELFVVEDEITPTDPLDDMLPYLPIRC